jgi:hypothetical protein
MNMDTGFNAFFIMLIFLARNKETFFMNVQPPTAFVEGKVGLKRILPTRAEGDADYEPTVSNSFFILICVLFTNMTSR